MLRGEFESPGELTPEELRDAYYARLRETVERAGVDAVSERTGVDRAVIEGVAGGETPELTLEAAAALLATDDDRPDAQSIQMEALDILLMGMTTAVLDVDAVSAGLDGALEPKEIQQKVEGRHPITLSEYAQLHRFIEGEA